MARARSVVVDRALVHVEATSLPSCRVIPMSFPPQRRLYWALDCLFRDMLFRYALLSSSR